MNLDSIKKIYFIGIGGIGMSALARYFNGLGAMVHGYDKTETELTKKLVGEGMKIHYEEDLSLIPEGVDLVVFTPAVPNSHLELQYFRENDFPVKKRAEVLGIISRARKTVGVAGTHGKTTTSSILTYLLREGGVDCTAFLGGISQNYFSNFVEGSSDWVVVEADEFDRSFLHLSPDMAIILSVDADHLDIYGDKENLLNSGFRAFAKRLKAGGKMWVRHDLVETFEEGAQFNTFGIGWGQFCSRNIRVEDGQFVFDYESPTHKINALRFAMPGKHNIENATAAISIALELGVGEAAIRRALQTFKGIKRRFEFMVKNEEVTYIDDYAHHPSELKAAIHAARQLFPGKKITGIFQPHLYTRTRDFADGFAEALDGLDETILLEIYPARELPIEGVHSEMILEKMKNSNKRLLKKDQLVNYVVSSEVEVLLTLGAGDISNFREPLKQILSSKFV